MDTKPTNPKDAIAHSKLPLDLVPDSLAAFAALAFLEGACKYGRYNWRVAGVRASVYRSALGRHLSAWWNGEDCDPDSGIPHLASVAACVAILIDAQVAGKLNDDRPPRAPVGDLNRLLADQVPNIRDQFADIAPRQWTIADSEEQGPCSRG